ncbi:MAG: short-chain dehydrogenase [Verrucomicrobiaceae bacterium]|nr:short-chain dehydrogenase [Verrucomicrobiaceae bacterium]
MEQLQGTVAIITGAASGIGRSTAISLARAGVSIIAADIDEAGAAKVAAKINSTDGAAFGVRCDVATVDAFEKLKDVVFDRFGRIDIVMNNVGVLTSGRPDELPVTEWERIFQVNLLSVIRSNAVFLPLLIAKGSGHIVNTSSFAGLLTYAFDRLPYAAAKAAIVQISEGLALYLRPQGIGVTCLCPGPVKTNIMSTTRIFSSDLDVRGPGPQFDLIEPDSVGDMVVDAIRTNKFMLFTHPQVRDLLIERATDFDAFLQKQIDAPHIIIKRSS